MAGAAAVVVRGAVAARKLIPAQLASQGWVVCREAWSAAYPSCPKGYVVQLRPSLRPRARAVVRLRGELTSSRVPRVRRRLLRAFARSPAVVEVDLGKVTYLAPQTRALLLAAAATARRSGVRLVITHASPGSLRVLEELGMQRLLDAPLRPLP
ncbi:STAS domain-containing protein [Streptomyces sp. NPDC047070]|uniref:STAS domain-containing protein n=1 Tax=Streptomyces sp. NPDC047070 TaxID=3154923 RepID=UPI003455EC00